MAAAFAACAGAVLASLPGAGAEDEETGMVRRLTGRQPLWSDRLRLAMPAIFANGYTVPLSLELDSPMTESDHVRYFQVFAPKNPIVEVARFQFTPRSGQARVTTRIRLAASQSVIAVAELSDGAMLMAKASVSVASNGCA